MLFILFLYVFLNSFCTKPKTFSPFFTYLKSFFGFRKGLKNK
ncbi:hypothetical protein CJJ81176_pVir0034 (plasmid) [Campylobacter jejuni subsp. jejuni 81-176]|uniref:Uncharacterized protein n=1 Tax=Campylobacter jejuni subsp. jejuni serotype O:23/36 (strain 81-176) TaxID=354242 RepID=A0A0H3P9D9_CAMJJ|nr:hypothetical protein CJSA_pVir0033 [Campylobacter jejuni subsp. jejuni IA3902]EAQ71735.1 hypothetical protein CJJ81176_pVir0034 [Campylobacter jejuni subsp. jejuni 81-176]